MQNATPATVAPWWKFGHVWMVLAGPSLVVVASFFTFYLAYVGMDTVVDEGRYYRAAASNQVLSQARQAPQNLTPAVQARNHAATAVVVPKDN